MPTIEGKEGKLWIDAYVKKGGKFTGVMKIVEAVKLNKKDPPSGKMVGMDKRRKKSAKSQAMAGTF